VALPGAARPTNVSCPDPDWQLMRGAGRLGGARWRGGGLAGRRAGGAAGFLSWVARPSSRVALPPEGGAVRRLRRATPAKPQVRAIRPALEPENAFVECQRLIDIANVESDVVDAEGLHCSNVTDGERSRCKSPVVRARL